MSTLSQARPRAARGDGSCTYVARRNQYRIRYYDRHGQPRDAWSPGPETPAAEQDARAKLRRLLVDRDAGKRPVGNSRQTVGSWLGEWLELKNGTAPETRRAYANRIELYLRPTLGHIRLRDLEPSDVARAMRQLGSPAPANRRNVTGRRRAVLSAGTIDAAYRCLKAALADAVQLGKAEYNAAALTSVDYIAPEILPPAQAEIDRLLDELRDHWSYPVLLTMRWTGCRHDEALGLRRLDVDPDARLVTFRRQSTRRRLKNSASVRTVVIPQELADVLRTLPAQLRTDRLFSTSTGKPIDQRNVLRRWRTACERLGIRPPAGADMAEYRPHDLRHAFATMLLESGAQPAVVSAWLGHASLREMDRYGHVRPIVDGDAARRVAAAFGSDTARLLRVAG